MRIIFCLAMLMMILGSCATRKQVTQDVITKNTDREVRETYRDTVILTGMSQTSLQVPVLHFNAPLMPNTIYRSSSGNASIRAKVENDTIYIDAKCDSLAIEAKIRDYYERIYSDRSESSIEDSKTGITRFELIMYCIATFALGFAVKFLLGKLRIL